MSGELVNSRAGRMVYGQRRTCPNPTGARKEGTGHWGEMLSVRRFDSLDQARHCSGHQRDNDNSSRASSLLALIFLGRLRAAVAA
jgi:hypothetical protein